MSLYKFVPILKSTLWGGDKIIAFKQLDSSQTQVGESWEISGVKGFETFVSEGKYKGKTINEVVSMEQERLMGVANYRRFGNEFPLLIKFIDAHRDLSIQVHPDDETAHRQGKESGKTEMWYCLPSDEGAELYNGLRRNITAEEYKQMVADDTICDALAKHRVHEGDVFFIPGGRIHSIGTGCFVTEIQQSCDVTYRIYDFKRKDKNGNYRALHIQEASESIDYHVRPDYHIPYAPCKNQGVKLVECPYFTTSVYDLDEPFRLDYSTLDSFVILICIGGKCLLTCDDGEQTTMHVGESLLVPATTMRIKVDGTVKFLETYV